MEQNVSEQIMSVVNQMAEKLGVAAEKVYPILLRQAYIVGFRELIMSIIFSILGFISIKTLLKTIRNPKVDSCGEWSEETGFKIFATGILSFACVLWVLRSINTIITALLNPDWYIINNLLKQLIK